MATDPSKRIALFIDGANLYSAVKGLGFDIDYTKLRDVFAAKGNLVRAYYYTAIFERDDYSALRPLIDWLDYNGYHVISKPAKEVTDREGRRRIKGNMDIEIAVDMLRMADHLDHMILFSGDGDFRALVEAVQDKGVKVTVISTRKTNPPMLGEELRRQADTVIDLMDLEDAIGRKSRPANNFDEDA